MRDETGPGIRVDDEGVWIGGYGGARHGVAWGELHSIAMYRIDLMTEVVTVVELERLAGESVELHSNVGGFDAAVQAIDARLRLDPRAVAAVAARGPDADPLVVWKRGAR